jgi:hypothetical protein
MIKKARDGDASGFVSQPSGSGLFRGVLCSDFDVPTTYDPLSAPVARLRHQAPRFGEWRYWDVVAACVGHPHPATNPPHRLKVSRNARVLVSSNTHDPATPLINALAVWRQIPGARLLIADADGHQALAMSQCARDAYLRFFDRRTRCRPSPGATAQRDIRSDIPRAPQRTRAPGRGNAASQ